MENSTIVAKNISKRYDDAKPVLQNFCMNVNSGTIYSLLGSSGCGKTTILSCIVGVSKWESGDMFLFGKRISPTNRENITKKLGYMPQDLALYNQLSIVENLCFFGKLYGMNIKEIEKGYRLLMSLLDLPDNFERIADLSGGQKRRASLAVALIHNPKLLMLDEPTVGLDPVLREKIRDYLRNLVNTRGCTILITTHYIEEARYSNTIGVMRNGRLIAEDNPSNLLQTYNCDLLQVVVSKLCRDDEQTKSSKQLSESFARRHYENITSFNDKSYIFQEVTFNQSYLSSENQYYSRISQRAANIYQVAKTILLTFIRFPIFLAILLCMPTIQCGISTWIMGFRVKDIHFGVVYHELLNWTTVCNLYIDHNNSCDFTTSSCTFLNKLMTDDTLILVSHETEEDALQQVHEGKSWGYLTIPENFSEHLADLAIAKQFALNETLSGSRLKLRLDHSEQLSTQFVIKHLYETFMNFLEEHSMACGIDTNEMKLPIAFRQPVYGEYSDSFRTFILPGALLLSIISLVTVLSGLLLINDYKQGTFSRARVAGLTMLDTILGHFVIQIPITLVQVLILTKVLRLMFGFTIQGSVFPYYLICLLTGIFGTSAGLIMGTSTRDEFALFVVAIFCFQVCLNFGGAFYSTEIMTWYWQLFGKVVPTNLPISALRSVSIRGLTFLHPLVWPGIVSLIVWTLVCVVACLRFSTNLNL